METIRNKADAKYFAEHFEEFADRYELDNGHGSSWGYLQFTIGNDPNISMINGGNTEITHSYFDTGEEADFDDEGNPLFYQYSSGPGWCDGGRSLIGGVEDFAEYVWQNRKGINTSLKQGGNNENN